MQATTHALQIFARVTAAIFGSYAFSWGFAALGVAGAVALGMPYDEARDAVMLVTFLIFLSMFLWSIAAASVAQVWLLLASGGVVMTTLAWCLQRSLIA